MVRRGPYCVLSGRLRVDLRRNCIARDRFSESFNDALNRDPLGFGAVIEQDSVAKGRIRERLDVFDGDVRSALEKRACLRTEDEELSGARSRAPTGPFVDEIRRGRLVWT